MRCDRYRNNVIILRIRSIGKYIKELLGIPCYILKRI